MAARRKIFGFASYFKKPRKKRPGIHCKTDILPIKMESIILELRMGVKDIEDKEDEVG